MRCNLFSIDIWKFKFPDLDHLARLSDQNLLSTLGLVHLDYISPAALRTSARSWERIPGNDRLHDRDMFVPLRDFVLEKSHAVWRELDYYHDQSPKIYQSWVNVVDTGGFALPHVHYNAALSAVVYISAGPNQGNLIFEDPTELALCAQPLSRKTERMRREIEVNTGDVVIFPGWIRHYTTTNQTTNQRISFIANLNGTGESFDPLAQGEHQ